MKFLAFKVVPLILLPILALCLCMLFLITIRSKRGSRLYRLRVSVLALIVSAWGLMQAGCGESPDGVESTCYVPADLKEDSDSPPDVSDPPAETKPDEVEFEATCYIPPDPRMELEISPEELEDQDEAEGEADDLDASAEGETGDEDGEAGEDEGEDESAGDASEEDEA